MEKIINNVSIKSRIINKLLIFSGYKRRYASEQNIKKWINKKNTKKYHLIKKIGMNKEKIDEIDMLSYNGDLRKAKKSIIIYIHGGSYVEDVMYLQIRFIKKLASKLDATLLIPIYKTAPEGNYELFEKEMDKLYYSLSKLNKKIIIIGDSAGGGFSLSYTMKLRNDHKKLPANLILFSPWLDITFHNPLVKKQSKLDNICSIEGNLYCGKIWADKLNVDDYRVSPINGRMNDLPRVTIITGGYDICKPDCIKLKEKLKSNNYPYDYIECSKLGHNFELYPTKEANTIIEDIINIIQNKI